MDLAGLELTISISLISQIMQIRKLQIGLAQQREHGLTTKEMGLCMLLFITVILVLSQIYILMTKKYALPEVDLVPVILHQGYMRLKTVML